jgi:hypothetical protein
VTFIVLAAGVTVQEPVLVMLNVPLGAVAAA